MPTATSLGNSFLPDIISMTSPWGTPTTSRGSKRGAMVLRIPGPADEHGNERDLRRELPGLVKKRDVTGNPRREEATVGKKCVLTDHPPRHRKSQHYGSAERHGFNIHKKTFDTVFTDSASDCAERDSSPEDAAVNSQPECNRAQSCDEIGSQSRVRPQSEVFAKPRETNLEDRQACKASDPGMDGCDHGCHSSCPVKHSVTNPCDRKDIHDTEQSQSTIKATDVGHSRHSNTDTSRRKPGIAYSNRCPPVLVTTTNNSNTTDLVHTTTSTADASNDNNADPFELNLCKNSRSLITSRDLDGTRSDLQQTTTIERIAPVPPTNNNPEKPPSVSTGEAEMVPVLKRKDSGKGRPRDRNVSVSDPQGSMSSSSSGQKTNKTWAGASASTPSADGDPNATQVPNLTKRRISFPADSVLTAVIQDGDTPELVRILTGRHGPGLVSGGEGRGVDVCQSNHVGLTALHHAVLANNLDAAKLLLCHGADVNAQDVHGFSPLHTAAACGFLPLTSILVLFGADVFSMTSESELPVDVARDLEVIRVLTSEMTRLIHQELWLTSLFRTRLEECWLLVRKVMACVLLFVLYLLMCAKTFWRKHKKRD